MVSFLLPRVYGQPLRYQALVGISDAMVVVTEGAVALIEALVTTFPAAVITALTNVCHTVTATSDVLWARRLLGTATFVMNRKPPLSTDDLTGFYVVITALANNAALSSAMRAAVFTTLAATLAHPNAQEPARGTFLQALGGCLGLAVDSPVPQGHLMILAGMAAIKRTFQAGFHVYSMHYAATINGLFASLVKVVATLDDRVAWRALDTLKDVQSVVHGQSLQGAIADAFAGTVMSAVAVVVSSPYTDRLQAELTRGKDTRRATRQAAQPYAPLTEAQVTAQRQHVQVRLSQGLEPEEEHIDDGHVPVETEDGLAWRTTALLQYACAALQIAGGRQLQPPDAVLHFLLLWIGCADVAHVANLQTCLTEAGDRPECTLALNLSLFSLASAMTQVPLPAAAMDALPDLCRHWWGFGLALLQVVSTAILTGTGLPTAPGDAADDAADDATTAVFDILQGLDALANRVPEGLRGRFLVPHAHEVVGVFRGLLKATDVKGMHALLSFLIRHLGQHIDVVGILDEAELIAKISEPDFWTDAAEQTTDPFTERDGLMTLLRLLDLEDDYMTEVEEGIMQASIMGKAQYEQWLAAQADEDAEDDGVCGVQHAQPAAHMMQAAGGEVQDEAAMEG
jgi:hypothetical protein